MIVSVVLHRLQKHEERDGHSLLRRESHWVHSAHEPVQASLLELADLLMLLEEIQGQNTRNRLICNPESQLALALVVKAACSSGVDILEVEDARVKEAVKSHERGRDASDDQASGIHDGRLAPGDLQANAHAVALLHGLDHIALRHGAHADLIDDLLVPCSDFIELEILDELLKLLLVCLKDTLILLGPLVDLLLLALTEGPESEIVELGDVQVAQMRNTAHRGKDRRRSLLEFSDLVHESPLERAVFDLHQSVRVQVDLTV